MYLGKGRLPSLLRSKNTYLADLPPGSPVRDERQIRLGGSVGGSQDPHAVTVQSQIEQLRLKEVNCLNWQIITDSSCDLKEWDEEIPFDSVPFVIRVDDTDYVDTPDLDVETLVSAMEKSTVSRTSCPSPEAWYQVFLRSEKTIALTISANLSGSYNSAVTAREMVLEKYPEKQIEIIDSLSTGPKLIMLAQQAAALIQEKLPVDRIAGKLRQMAGGVHTLFTLCSFRNLVNNGRVSRLAGFLAGMLNIRAIGAGSPDGIIEVREKLRGEGKTLKAMVEIMAKEGFRGTEVVISHCLNEGLAETFRKLVQERWPHAPIQIFPTRGLDSYYAERSGLIVCY